MQEQHSLCTWAGRAVKAQRGRILAEPTSEGQAGRTRRGAAATTHQAEAEERRKYGFRMILRLAALWLPLEAREVLAHATELLEETLLATIQPPTTILCQRQALLTKATAARTARAGTEKVPLELQEAAEAVDTLAA